MPGPILLLLGSLLLTMRLAESYPMLAQVDEGEERCFNFNIPEDDDAHLVFVVIPSEDDIEDSEESWYIDQVFKLTKKKSEKTGVGGRFIDKMPDNISKQQKEFMESTETNESPVSIELSVNPSTEHPIKYKNRQQTKYFLPTVFGHVRKTSASHSHNQGFHVNNLLRGYRICMLNNDQDRQVQIIIDVVMMSQTSQEEEKAAGFEKEKHLTPLEQSLDQNIAAANKVLREMKYMEQREYGMRMTAESINARVRWFSYLSVAVLLVVTYVQVTYLKRYFHKKKLM